MKTLLFYLIPLIMYPGKRQVLLFYTDDGEAVKNKQVAILGDNRKGLAERDITVYVYGINTHRAAAAKWHIEASAAFTFLLIGKDGGEKLRSDTVVSAEKLFGIIDAMPMRKEEMKRQQ